MTLLELFILAVGLSMDAFAVSICKGLGVKGELRPRHAVLTGLYFGSFQGLMPLAGYILGIQFAHFIQNVDHWIAFVLLGLIGLGMIKGSRETACPIATQFGFKAMLPLAIATSIDALAAGITLAFLKVDILPAVLFIGITTFTLSAFGVWVGHRFGAKYKSKAELAGGIVLVLMGGKILVEHLGLFG